MIFYRRVERVWWRWGGDAGRGLDPDMRNDYVKRRVRTDA